MTVVSIFFFLFLGIGGVFIQIPVAAVSLEGGSGLLSSAQCPPSGERDNAFCEQTPDNSGRCVTQPIPPPNFSYINGDNVTALYSGALGQPGRGAECCGFVAEAMNDVDVYRAWAPHPLPDATTGTPSPSYFPAYQFGAWWSAAPPTNQSHFAYHIDADVCQEWNTMTVVSKCKLAGGQKVVIGPGQSACCSGGSFFLGQSPELQVWIPTPKGRSTVQSVFHDCETYMWPLSRP